MDSLLDVCQQADYVNVSLQLSIKSDVLFVEWWESFNYHLICTVTLCGKLEYIFLSSSCFKSDLNLSQTQFTSEIPNNGTNQENKLNS